MMKKIKTNKYFLIFLFAISFFYLFCVHIVTKSDDGHFLSILSQENFNLIEWLEYRYNNISGRTFCEFFTMFFMSKNFIFYKVFSIILWIIFFVVITKLMSVFDNFNSNSKIAVACIPFLIWFPCFNSSVSWLSGAFTYFVPFAFFLMTLAPIAFDILDIKYKKILWIILSIICAMPACSQEQSAAITITFYIIFLIIVCVKKKLKFYHFIPFILSLTETIILFSAPGMNKRMEMESDGFPSFNSFNFIDKILCGISNYFAFEFLTSLIAFGLFIFLLVKTVKATDNKINKILAKIIIITFGFVSVILNLIYICLNGMIADKGFENLFKAGEIKTIDVVMICGCFILFIEILVGIARIFISDKKIGISVGLCYLTSVCSGTILGFSSSIYASGQRVFFFSEIFLLISTVIMFTSLKNTEFKIKLRNIMILLSFIFYCVNFITTMFMDTPIMG